MRWGHVAEEDVSRVCGPGRGGRGEGGDGGGGAVGGRWGEGGWGRGEVKGRGGGFSSCLE